MKPTKRPIPMTWILFFLALAACQSSPTTTAPEAKSSAEEVAQRPAAPAAPASDQAKAPSTRVFVSNYRSDTISVLEGVPEIETNQIEGFESPHGMAIRPTEPAILAIAESTGNGVKFVNPRTLEVTASINDITPGPQDLEFSPDGKTLYVVGTSEGTLSYIDVDSRQEVGEKTQFAQRIRRIVVAPDTGTIYTIMIQGGDLEAAVAAVDPKTRKVIKTTRVDTSPHALDLGNNGKLLVVSSFEESTLTMLDPKTLEIINKIESETGMGLNVHPTKPLAYSMASFDDEFFLMNLETGETVKDFAVGRWPTYGAMDKQGRYLYVAHEESDSVVKIDIETNQIAAKSVVGREPIEVEIWEP